MAITGKKILHRGSVTAVTWVGDGGVQFSAALRTGSDAEIRTLLDADAIILDADSEPLIFTQTRALTGRVTTTNATATEIFRGALTPATGYIATLDIIGVQNAAPFDRCVIRASAAAARTSNGAILDGQDVIHPPFKTAGATTWTALASVSGNDFVISVTGQAGKTINWTLRGEFYAFTPSGA